MATSSLLAMTVLLVIMAAMAHGHHTGDHELTNGKTLSVQPSTLSTVFKYKSSGDWEFSTAVVKVDRIYDQGTMYTVSVDHCVHPEASGSSITTYPTRSCNAALDEDCSVFIPTCYLKRNTIIFIRVESTSLALQYNVTINQTRLVPEVVPAASAVQTVSLGNDKVYEFTPTDVQRWMKAVVTPSSSNTAPILLEVAREYIPGANGCSYDYSAETPMNLSLAKVQYSPICGYSTGRYFARVSTTSEQSQSFTFAFEHFDPAPLDVTAGTKQVMRYQEQLYKFTTNGNNTLFRIVVDAHEDNNVSLSVSVSRFSVPDLGCISFSSSCTTTTGDCTTTYVPSCGYVNDTYYILVSSNALSYQYYTVSAVQIAPQIQAIPAANHSVISPDAQYYSYAIQDTSKEYTFKLTRESVSSTVTMQVLPNAVPYASCSSLARTCSITTGSPPCSVTFSPTCWVPNGTYYVRISTSNDQVLQNYSLEVEEKAWPVETLTSNLYGVTNEEHKFFNLTINSNTSYFIVNVTADANNTQSITAYIADSVIPDPNNLGCTSGEKSCTAAAGASCYLTYHPTCGYRLASYLLRVRTTSGTTQNFTVSYSEVVETLHVPQENTPYETTVGTNILFNITVTDPKQIVDLLVEAESTNVVVYLRKDVIPSSACLTDTKTCTASRTCQLLYSETCDTKTPGIYYARIAPSGGSRAVFNISFKSYEPALVAPPSTLEDVVLYHDKYYSLTTDSSIAPNASVVVVVLTSDAGNVGSLSLAGQRTPSSLPPTRSCTPTICSGIQPNRDCMAVISPNCGYDVNGTYSFRVATPSITKQNYTMSIVQKSTTTTVPVPTNNFFKLECNPRDICFYTATIPASALTTRASAYEIIVRPFNTSNTAPLTFTFGQQPWPVSGCGETFTCGDSDLRNNVCNFGWTPCMGDKIYMSLASQGPTDSNPAVEISIQHREVAIKDFPYHNVSTDVEVNAYEPVVLRLPTIHQDHGYQTLRLLLTTSASIDDRSTYFVSIYKGTNPNTCQKVTSKLFACHNNAPRYTQCVVSVPTCEFQGYNGDIYALITSSNRTFFLRAEVDQAQDTTFYSRNYYPYDSSIHVIPHPPEEGFWRLTASTSDSSDRNFEVYAHDTNCGSDGGYDSLLCDVHTSSAQCNYNLRCLQKSQDSLRVVRKHPAPYVYMGPVQHNLQLTPIVPGYLLDNTTYTHTAETWFRFRLASTQDFRVNVSILSGGTSDIGFVVHRVKDCTQLGEKWTSYLDVDYSHYAHGVVSVNGAEPGLYYVQVFRSFVSALVRVKLTFSGEGAVNPNPKPYPMITCTYVDQENPALNFCKGVITNGYYYISNDNSLPHGPSTYNSIANAQAAAFSNFDYLRYVTEGGADCNKSLVNYACAQAFTPCGEDGTIKLKCAPDCRKALESCTLNACIDPLCQAVGGSCVETFQATHFDAAPSLALAPIALLLAVLVALF